MLVTRDGHYLSKKSLYFRIWYIPMTSSSLIGSFFLFIILSLPHDASFDIFQKAIAQNSTNSSSSTEQGEAHVDDAIQALKNNDTNKARVHINILKQQFAVLPDTNSSVVN
jgi:hypothetical protein